MVTHKFKLHRVSNDEDEVIGTFEIQGEEIVFPTNVDRHHCDMFPPGKMSDSTKNRISELLDNKQKTMYLEKVK